MAFLLFQKLVVMFIFLLCGFLLVRSGILRSEDSKPLSTVSMYVLNPCVIIHSFQIDYTPEVRDGVLLTLLLAVIAEGFLLALDALFHKSLKFTTVDRLSTVYSNAGSLIVPVVTSVFGAEWVIFANSFLCVQNLLLWSHAKMVISGETKLNWKKLASNINLIAIFFGFIMFVTRLQLPSLLTVAMTSLGDMIGPVCMLVIGMILAGLNFKNIFLVPRYYFISFIRLIVYPVLTGCLLIFSGLPRLHPDGNHLVLITLLAVMAPTATIITQLAQVYGHDEQRASCLNALTTLLCIITMPLMFALFQLLQKLAG